MKTLFDTLETPSGITPYPFQREAIDRCFEMWNAGNRGSLIRIFTGGGKTLTTAMLFKLWLDTDPNNRCMFISYEQQLVYQSAEEIADTIGISPSIEMGDLEIDPGFIPKIVIASRQSLALRPLATTEQKSVLQEEFGIDDLGVLTKSKTTKLITALRKGMTVESARDVIEDFHDSYKANLEVPGYSRLWKFDPRHNWLLAFDEAHKHKYALKTVQHIVDWFDSNEESKRVGCTATPKRSDKVSIGHKMFPCPAIDFPLYSRDDNCAVKQGYAVPYKNKFIEVEGVDFTQVSKVAGDFSDEELDRILNTEEMLAKLVDPLLDLCGDRRTLIFSITIEMAKNVCDYINARAKCRCECGVSSWHSKAFVGDGAQCECGKLLEQSEIISRDVQAKAVWGEVPHEDRKDIYHGHQTGDFQFLSVCGLCREGYNDPDIACVAILRPVSKAASSLAEQMKGRGSRPLRGLITGLDTAEERLEAIANSDKPDCLIIDLVGVTGLADCASTIQIYAEGLPDEVIERAEQIATIGGVEDVQEAIEQAEREIAEERERKRREAEEARRRARELAEQRSRLGAKARYTVHDQGTTRIASSPNGPSEGQLRFLYRLGLNFDGIEISKAQAKRAIGQLHEQGLDRDEVRYKNGWSGEEVTDVYLTANQKMKLTRMGIPYEETWSIQDASDAIDGNGGRFDHVNNVCAMLERCNSNSQLNVIGKQLQQQRSNFSAADWEAIVETGRERRAILNQED